MIVTFDTKNYRTLHRHEPKGKGVWAFTPEFHASESESFFTPCLTYTDAKKFAKAKYPNATLFYVLG